MTKFLLNLCRNSKKNRNELAIKYVHPQLFQISSTSDLFPTARSAHSAHLFIEAHLDAVAILNSRREALLRSIAAITFLAPLGPIYSIIFEGCTQHWD